jgi:hypothetical protein
MNSKLQPVNIIKNDKWHSPKKQSEQKESLPKKLPPKPRNQYKSPPLSKSVKKTSENNFR